MKSHPWYKLDPLYLSDWPTLLAYKLWYVFLDYIQMSILYVVKFVLRFHDLTFQMTVYQRPAGWGEGPLSIVISTKAIMMVGSSGL